MRFVAVLAAMLTVLGLIVWFVSEGDDESPAANVDPTSTGLGSIEYFTCAEWDTKISVGDEVEIVAVDEEIFTVLNYRTGEEIQARNYFRGEGVRRTEDVRVVLAHTTTESFGNFSVSTTEYGAPEMKVRGRIRREVCGSENSLDQLDGKVLRIEVDFPVENPYDIGVDFWVEPTPTPTLPTI